MARENQQPTVPQDEDLSQSTADLLGVYDTKSLQLDRDRYAEELGDIGDDAPGYDEILAEHAYNETTKAGQPSFIGSLAAGERPVGNNTLVPPPRKQDIQSREVPLSKQKQWTKSYSEHFKPSHTYHGRNDPEHHQDEKSAAPSLLERLRQRAKSAPEAPSLSVEEAAVQARLEARQSNARMWISVLFFLPALLVTVGQSWHILPPFLQYQVHPYLVLMVLSLLQFGAILCGLQPLARGVRDLLRVHLTAEGLTAVSAVASYLYVFSITNPFGGENAPVGFLPYTILVCASITAMLWGDSRRAAGLYYAHRTAQAAEASLVLESALLGTEDGFVRGEEAFHAFPATAVQEPAPRVFAALNLFLLTICVVLAAVIGGVEREGSYFFWALSALTAAAVPLTAWGGFWAVYRAFAIRFAKKKVAVPGWSCVKQLSRSRLFVLSDNDVFPPVSIGSNGYRCFRKSKDEVEMVVRQTLSLLAASGTPLFRALQTALKNEINTELLSVSDFEAMDNGISGCVDGDRVFIGTLRFMESKSVSIPQKEKVQDAFFVAVNFSFSAVFSAVYNPLTAAKDALRFADRHKLAPILAARDFNVTSGLVAEQYDFNKDMIQYPVPEVRFALSASGRPVKGSPVAALAASGVAPIVEAMVGGTRLRRTAELCIAVDFFARLVGMFAVFFIAGRDTYGAAASISPPILLAAGVVFFAVQRVLTVFGKGY